VRVVGALLAATLVVTACTGMPTSGGSPSPTGPLLRVGSGPESESLLLAGIVSDLLEAEGFRTFVDRFQDSQDARQALEVGDVDLLPGYTGQAWLEVLGRPNPSGDPRTSFARVRSADEANGIVWLRPAFEVEKGIDGPPANATFGMFVRGVPSVDADLRTMVQLATRLAQEPDAVVCVDKEFAQRPDGWTAVAVPYGIDRSREVTEASPDVAVASVAVGRCMVGLSTATDGRAWEAGLVLLEDPLGVFPAFVVSVQVRDTVLDTHPELDAALAPLLSQLTTRMLGTWNGRVVSGMPIEDVAAAAATSLRRSAGMEPAAVDASTG
jgi:osmoprotectant transport system substrate-binding protein